jgi:hypothetical protein
MPILNKFLLCLVQYLVGIHEHIVSYVSYLSPVMPRSVYLPSTDNANILHLMFMRCVVQWEVACDRCASGDTAIIWCMKEIVRG